MTDKEIESSVKELTTNQKNFTEWLKVFQVLNDALMKTETVVFESKLYKLLKIHLQSTNLEIKKNALYILCTCLKKGFFKHISYIELAYQVVYIGYNGKVDTAENQEIWLKAFSSLEDMDELFVELCRTRSPHLISILNKALGTNVTSSLQKIKALQMFDKLISHINIETLQDSILPLWLEQIFPLMFNMNNLTIQTCAIEISYRILPQLQLMLQNTAEHWDAIYVDTRKKYYPVMTALIEKENCLYAKLWIFLIKLLGTKFHRGSPVVNLLLSIIEIAFKTQNLDVRMQAFYCWQALFECFALDPNEIYTTKRIKLLTIPLKTNNCKTEELVKVKFLTWCKLLNVLNMKKLCCSLGVLDTFLNFCFGPLCEQSLIFYTTHGSGLISQGKKYSSLHLMSCKAFLHLLGIRKYIDEELYSKLTYFNFEGPVITSVEFVQFSKTIVDSVGESCVMLSQLENSDRFECCAINEALWKSLFSLVDSLVDEKTKLKITEEIAALILALAGVARKKSNLIHFGLVPLFNIITSGEFQFFKNEKISELLFIPMVQTVIKKDKALLQHDVISIFKKIFMYNRNDKQYLKFVQTVLEKFSLLLKENIILEKLTMLHEIWFLLEEELRNHLLNTVKHNIDQQLYTTVFSEFFIWPIATMHRIANKEKLVSKWKDLYDLYNQCQSGILQNKLACSLLDNICQISSQNATQATVAEFVYFIITNLKYDACNEENCGDVCNVYASLKKIFSLNSLTSEVINIYENCVQHILETNGKLPYIRLLLFSINAFIRILLEIHAKIYILPAVKLFIESINYNEKLKLGFENLIEVLKSINNSQVPSEKIEKILMVIDFKMSYKTLPNFNYKINTDLNMDSTTGIVKNIDKIEKEQATIELGHDINTMTPVKMKDSVLKKADVKSNDKIEKEKAIVVLGHDINTMTPVKMKGSVLQQADKESPKNSPHPLSQKNTIDDELLCVNVPYKFDPKKLTKQQKEKLSRRRDDIPALYQDLSQSQTQNFNSNSESFSEAPKKSDNQTKEIANKKQSKSDKDQEKDVKPSKSKQTNIVLEKGNSSEKKPRAKRRKSLSINKTDLNLELNVENTESNGENDVHGVNIMNKNVDTDCVDSSKELNNLSTDSKLLKKVKRKRIITPSHIVTDNDDSEDSVKLRANASSDNTYVTMSDSDLNIKKPKKDRCQFTAQKSKSGKPTILNFIKVKYPFKEKKKDKNLSKTETDVCTTRSLDNISASLESDITLDMKENTEIKKLENKPFIPSARIRGTRRKSTGCIKRKEQNSEKKVLDESDLVSKDNRDNDSDNELAKKRRVRIRNELLRIKMDINHSEEYMKSNKRKTRMSAYNNILENSENAKNTNANIKSKVTDSLEQVSAEKVDIKPVEADTESDSVIDSSQEPDINIKQCNIPVLYPLEEIKPGEQMVIATSAAKLDIVKGPKPSSPFKVIETIYTPVHNESTVRKQIVFDSENSDTTISQINNGCIPENNFKEQKQSVDTDTYCELMEGVSSLNDINYITNNIHDIPVIILKENEILPDRLSSEGVIIDTSASESNILPSSETQSVSTEMMAELNAQADENIINIENNDNICRKVLFNDSVTSEEDAEKQKSVVEQSSPPPSEIKTNNIITSPISSDTPTRNKELLRSTMEISPIKNLSRFAIDMEEAVSPTAMSTVPIENENIEDNESPELFTSEPTSSMAIPSKNDEESDKTNSNSPYYHKLMIRKNRTKSLNCRSAQMMDMISAKTTLNSSPAKKRKSSTKSVKSFCSPSQNRIMKMMGQLEKRDNQETLFEVPDNEVIKNEDIFTFTRELPSPYISPAIGILKRSMPDEPDDGTPRPSKRRRVNFSDPPVSCRKFIEKNAKQKCSTDIKLLDFIPQEPRVTRSTKEGSEESESTENTESIESTVSTENSELIENPNNSTENNHNLTDAIADRLIKKYVTGSVENPVTSSEEVENVEITTNSDDKQKSICESLINCTEPVKSIIHLLTTPDCIEKISSVIESKNITVISELAKLQELEITKIPLEVEKVRSVLKEYSDNLHNGTPVRGHNENLNGDSQKSCEVSVITSPVKNKEKEKLSNENLPEEIVTGETTLNSIQSLFSDSILKSKEVANNKEPVASCSMTPTRSIFHENTSTKSNKVSKSDTVLKYSPRKEQSHSHCLSPNSIKDTILNEEVAGVKIQNLILSIIGILNEKKYDPKPLLNLLFGGISDFTNILVLMNPLRVHHLAANQSWEEIIGDMINHLGIWKLMKYLGTLKHVSHALMIESLLKYTLHDIGNDFICERLNINEVIKYVARECNFIDILKQFDSQAVYRSIYELVTDSKFTELKFRDILRELYSVIIDNPKDVSLILTNLNMVEIGDVIVERISADSDMNTFLKKIYNSVPSEQYLKPVPKKLLLNTNTLSNQEEEDLRRTEIADDIIVSCINKLEEGLVSEDLQILLFKSVVKHMNSAMLLPLFSSEMLKKL